MSYHIDCIKCDTHWLTNYICADCRRKMKDGDKTQ